MKTGNSKIESLLPGGQRDIFLPVSCFVICMVWIRRTDMDAVWLGSSLVHFLVMEAVTIVDYREILRLRSLGYNITQIADAIHELLYPERMNKAHAYMEPDCAYIHKELVKKGVNLTLLHNEYKLKCINAGLQYCPVVVIPMLNSAGT